MTVTRSLPSVTRVLFTHHGGGFANETHRHPNETLAPALDAVARRLAPGAVSEEVETPDGLHLLLRHP